MAKQQVELSCPPAYPVFWTFRNKDQVVGGLVSVRARTWFEARAKASIELGLAPEDIDGSMDKRRSTG